MISFIAFFDKVLFGVTDFLPKIITAIWLYIEIKSMDETSMKLGNRSFWIIIKEFILKLKTLKSDVNELVDDKKILNKQSSLFIKLFFIKIYSVYK